jgi:uncharacterized membrane protein
MTTLARRTYAVMIGGALLWCLLLAAAPLATAAGWRMTGTALYRFFDRICHQLEGRSLHLAGEPLAVCARCTAIYASFTLGLLLVPLLRRLEDTALPPRWVLLASLAPMALDVASGLLGLRDVTTASRLATGAVAGVILAQFLVPAAVGGIAELIGATAPSPSPHHLEGRADA